MRYNELLEKRKNPQLNKKESLQQLFLKYKDNPNIYIHTGKINKIGTNPSASEEKLGSPLGIYTFNLSRLYNDINNEYDMEDEIIHDDMIYDCLPFKGGDNIYFLEADIKKDSLKNYTKENLKNDLKKLISMFGKEAVNDAYIDSETYYTRQPEINFIGLIYNTARKLSLNLKTSWTKILLKLGINYLDDTGQPIFFIHVAEPFQTVFFDKSLYKVVDHYLMNKKDYQSQKVLNVYSPLSVLISKINNPKTINIEQANGIIDLSNLPFSNDGSIHKRFAYANVTVKDYTMDFYDYDDFKYKFLKSIHGRGNPLFKIINLIIDTENKDDIAKVIKLLRDNNFNIENIK